MTETASQSSQTYIDEQRTIITPLGKVSVIRVNDAIPEGWRILTLTEGRQIKEHLGSIVGDDTTVAFVQGRLDGHAHGN